MPIRVEDSALYMSDPNAIKVCCKGIETIVFYPVIGFLFFSHSLEWLVTPSDQNWFTRVAGCCDGCVGERGGGYRYACVGNACVHLDGVIFACEDSQPTLMKQLAGC